MSAARPEVARILRDAAGLLRTKGWTQGTFARTADGQECSVPLESHACFCSLGAIEVASGGIHGRYRTDAERALVVAIAGAEDDVDVVACWNDAPGRTVDEVLAMFERAASALEVR